jgi:hypothetical protein
MKKIKFFFTLLALGLFFSVSNAQDCDLPLPYTGNTGSNMTMLLTSNFVNSLNATDENAYVVVLTPAGLVVGSAQVYGLTQNSIAIWANDTQTPETDGALAAEVLNFQF